MPRNLSDYQAHADLAQRAQQQAAERAAWARVLAPRQSPRDHDALALEPMRAAVADSLATQGAWA